jgi:hypothetical protein
MSQTPPDVAHLRHLEDTVLESLSDVEEILERTPTELDHNQALEKGIVFQVQLNKLIESATKRFNDALLLLEHYNEVVGQRLRRAAQKLFAPRRKRKPRTARTSASDRDQRAGAASNRGAKDCCGNEIDALAPKVLKKYNNELKSKKQARGLGLIVPGRIFSLLQWSDSIEHERHALEIAQKLVEQNERDQFAALEAAAVDLVRLERYEQRCWSRQKRAIRNFMNQRMIVDMNHENQR